MSHSLAYIGLESQSVPCLMAQQRRLASMICRTVTACDQTYCNAGLVLKIFLALLPMLLTFMNKRAGMQSLAEIDYGVFQKYFIFQARTVTLTRAVGCAHLLTGLLFYDPADMQPCLLRY